MMFSTSNKLKLTALLTIALLQIVSADILQNSGFETPPSNWTANSTSPFVPLNNNSIIQGWTIEGAVEYVTSGADFSLPGDGHAILLGQDGKINQTFTANGEQMTYLITFTLAIGGRNCQSNASLVISAPDSSAEFSFSGNYSRQPWEVYGHKLGSWRDGEAVNLVFESQAADSDPNSTCWPVIDDLLVNTIGSPSKGNLLLNGGFELGPAFPEVTDIGVLLDSELSLLESALPQWTITGTVRYINSNDYSVPEGKAAVELISGVPSGVSTSIELSQGSNYNLEFILAGTNSSCPGDFTVGVTVGSTVQNFTINSDGTASSAMAFSGAGSSPTPISFQSYTARQTHDGAFCGAVIDGVVLHGSTGQRTFMNGALLVCLLFVAFLKLSELA